MKSILMFIIDGFQLSWVEIQAEHKLSRGHEGERDDALDASSQPWYISNELIVIFVNNHSSCTFFR